MTKRQFGILASLQVAILASVIGVGAVLIQRLDSPGSAVDLAVIRGAVSSSLIMKGTYPRSLYDVASDAAAAAAAKPTTVVVKETVTPAAPAAPAVTNTQAAAVAKLKELKSLQKQGLITEAQYQTESQKILNQLVE